MDGTIFVQTDNQNRIIIDTITLSQIMQKPYKNIRSPFAREGSCYFCSKKVITKKSPKMQVEISMSLYEFFAEQTEACLRKQLTV